MRKLPSILAAAGLLSVALTGCSSIFGDAACEPPGQSDTIADLVQVRGEVGSPPTITAFTPIRTTSLATTDLTIGTGTVLTSTAQTLLVDITLFFGESGEQLVGTHYDGDLSRTQTVQTWMDQSPGLGQAMVCAAEGSRILALLSPDDIGEGLQQSLGLSAEESLIAVIDVRKVFLAHAVGSAVFNTARGLPSVVRAPDGRPGITVPGGEPPAELVTQVLIRGDGEPVTAQNGFRVHYTGVLWASGKVFDSSWDTGAARFTLQSLVPGVSQALEGQTVGSQVLVIVPPELGYGDEARGSIPGGSTLVFVFDILGIDALPAG